MNDDPQKRKDAIRSLANLAMLEIFVLLIVVAIYLYTNSAVFLAAGLTGWVLIFGPLFYRWWKAHAAALTADRRGGSGS